MKTLLAILALAFSLNALAIDVTITLTASQATRFAAACGTVKQLVDAKGVPRPCTNAEAKQMIVERMRQLVVDVEGKALTDAAVNSVVVPAFDPQ